VENNLFETDRLIVRKLTQNDAEFLFKYSQEEITKKELPDEVFNSTIETKEKIDHFISNYNNKYPLVYGIVKKENNIIIGHLSLSEIKKGIEIGYAIATDYQNNGYISEIIGPFMDWVKEKLKIRKIYGIVKKENMYSWKILEKNGFSLENEGVDKNYFEGNYIVKIYEKILC
jgi:ribosomal-protein-alanine N-acetyltransferase